jgi:hypothetical protein
MCISIERLGPLNHLLRDIYANTRGKVSRQRLRQPTNTAPKIQCCTVGVGNAVNFPQVIHDGLNFSITGRHELRDVPFPACLAAICENGPESIALSERVPIVLNFVESDHNSHAVRRRSWSLWFAISVEFILDASHPNGIRSLVPARREKRVASTLVVCLLRVVTPS